MNSKINELTSKLTKKEGAKEEAVAALSAASKIDLPREYLSFLMCSNGASGFIGSSYLIIWPAEDVLKLSDGYGSSRYTPDFLLFGSDGGGTGYAFDNREGSTKIVEVPFVSISYEDAILRGKSFEDFLEFLYIQWPTQTL